MLSDPKNVAKGIKYIFRSKKEKQRMLELERDSRLRQGKHSIRTHIVHQNAEIPKLVALAKRSLALGDEPRFQQIGRQIIWTENDIIRWQKYLITVEILESRRDQVRAFADLIGTVKTMTDSMRELAGTEQVIKLQQQLDESLSQTASTEERIDMMMDMMDSTLSEGSPADEKAIESLRSSLGEAIITQESSQFDKELEAGLDKIRKQLADETSKKEE